MRTDPADVTKVTAVIAVVLLVLTYASFVRNSVWSDDISLWTDVAEKCATKRRAYANVGIEYRKQNKIDEAIAMSERSLAIEPNAPAYNTLGIIAFDRGLFPEAIAYYSKAVAADATYADAYVNRGNALDENGQSLPALEDYNTAIRLNPDFANAYYNRGVTLEKLGRLSEAQANLARACSLGRVEACRGVK